MAATMYRGRSLRRSKGRHDSGDTDVPLDLNKAPKDNIQEILTSLTRNSGLTKGKKLGHLNNFVKLINHVSSFDKLGYSVAEIICCLRLAVVHPAKEIRGAGVRALRHLVQDEVTVQAMLALHVDRLLMRSLDIYQRNDVERVQALRFIRRILAVAPAFCPISLVHVLVAVSNSDDKERDRMRNACVATLCELAVLNPGAFAHARGLGALVRNILDMQLLRINEAVMLTVLHLLNHPASRRFIRFKVDLEQVIAPFTDFNYRHTGDSLESQASEKEGLYQASRMAIVTLLRSWPGMIRLCRSDATGLQSLLAILCVHNDENRRYLLEVLYDIFYLPIPEWTDDFPTALQSIDSCQMKSSWTLSEGFVVAEALDLLPNRASTRPNLTENHLALLLLAFINAGLLESLVEVVTSDNANLSIQATILLGELLYMADKILPPECEQHHHCLPTLMTLAASFDVPLLQRNRASAAVTNLERHHEMKKRGVIPCSLYLDHILSNSDMFVTQKVVADKSKDTPVVSRSRSRSFSSALGMTSSWDKISNRSTQENEDSAVQTMIKETLVLTTKDHTVWNWELIGGAIKKGGVTLKKFEDANVNRFFRRLVEFYKPMSKQYSVISLGRELGRSSEIQSYTIIGCQLLNFLLNCDEADAEKLLMELAVDIGDCLLEISMAPRNELPPQAVFSPSSIQNTLSQDYFLLVGKLSKTHEGEKILEKAGVFQYLLDVCSMPHHETLQKLVVTCLDYKRDGLARTVLGKMLAGSSESMRIYATNHLRVLLRAQTPFFHTWGVELLITQLHDKARSISSLALDILDEACEDDANLHSLVHMRPPLLHMGDKGALLLTRFISTTKGFKYLHDVNYVCHELERWYTYFNRKYVTLIETEINEAFTCYHRPQISGGFIRRSKDERRQRKDVYVPVHLYGQLAKHRGGCELIEKQNHVQEMCEVIRYGDIETMDTILNLKAALWALGHTGSTTWGLKLLQQESIIPDIIRLAEECEVFSIRGTCFYVLGLISKTRQGADSLSSLGWESIRHSRGDYFPVMEDRENVATALPLEEYNHNHRDLSSPVSLPGFSPYSIDSPKTPGDSSSTPKVDPNVKFFAGDPSPVQSPQTPGGPPNFFLEVTGETNSGGDAKTHPSTEERSTSPSPLVRLSKRDRVNSATEQLPGINEVSDGGRTIVVDRASRTPLLRRAQTMPTIEGQDDDEPPPFDSVITKLRSNSDASSRMCKDKSSEGVRFNQDVHERSRAQSRERSHSLKRRCDSNESGNSSMGTKSRSESFATDTSQTSGVGSMHSNPSSPPVESSMSSVSTVSSSMTVKSIHSSDTLRKRHNLKRTPSFVRRISKTLSPNLSSYSNLFETSAAFTSVRDAHGYATLKALKLQHRQLSRGEDDSMIKRASSFGNPGEMKFRRGLSGMVESVSMSCLERASVISKAPSMKSLHQTSSTSSKTEYIGLCLPVDVTLIFHSDESQYKDGHSAPTSHAVSPAMTDIHIPQVQVYSPDSGSTSNSNAPTQLESPPTTHPSEQHGTTQQQTLSMGNADYSNLRIAEENESDVREEEEEEEVHIDNNLHQIEHCLACTKVRTRSLESQEGDSIIHPDDPASLVIFQPVDPPQPLLIRSRGNSSASASNPFGSNSVDNNTPTSVGSSGTSVSQSSQGTVRMRDDTPKGREMIRREVIRLVIKMSSSVGMKAHEEGLLGLREKFPKAFERTCLFSDVMNLLATSSYRLSSRRFIQELFQEVNFNEIHHEAERILGLEESSDTPSTSSGS